MMVLILAMFIVTCVSTTNATTTTTESTTTESMPSETTELRIPRSINPSDDYFPYQEIKTCGTKYGTPAAKKQFPYVAFLKSRNVYKVQYCSGSVIHPTWVLTSAYCTLPDSTVEVTLGGLIPLNEEDPDKTILHSVDVYIHPEYLPVYKEPKNDVALIKLSTPVKSVAVIPIHLKRDFKSISKDSITFAGWGESGYETLSFTRRIQISKGPCRCRNADMKQGFDDAAVDSEFLCALSQEYFCFIHNGGGLVVDGVLVAVLSTRCFSHCRDLEGIFTNLYKHRQWINDTMNTDHSLGVYSGCSDKFVIYPGVYLIQLNDDMKPFKVYCDTVDDKKWTVIQQRFNGSVDFYRNYANYTMGFGPVDGNHWLGLEKIHQLTKNGDHELRVELQAHNLTRAYAQYSTFQVYSAWSGFKLKISGYSGNAGDSTYGDSYTNDNGRMFTTYDKDQDMDLRHCAEQRRGAWWYSVCGVNNLNGPYHNTAVKGEKTMFWEFDFGIYALKSSRMLIRKK